MKMAVLKLATVFFESGVIVLFTMAVLLILQNKRIVDLLILFAGACFGVTLEFMNVLIYSGYHYSPDFLLQVGQVPENVPLVIGLAWGLIIYSAMSISDSFRMNVVFRPFLDTLLALTIDLSMDAIAIRLDSGFWTWGTALKDIISLESFYGVPYGNFYGWFMVVLIFSFLARGGRYLYGRFPKLALVYFITIPFLSYIPLYISLEFIFHSFNILAALDILGYSTVTINLHSLILTVAAILTAALAVIFGLIRERGAIDTDQVEKFQFFISASLFTFFHVSFVIAAVIYQIVLLIPLAAILGLVGLVVSFVFHASIYLAIKRTREASIQ